MLLINFWRGLYIIVLWKILTEFQKLYEWEAEVKVKKYNSTAFTM